ncbi:hypothetical protein [Streptomyces sp. OE57]|uniref:hypothetical protein n=1 Tax=Streptomyces lacaronensis TaxID=3379885 RepID=UPI0039B72E55
MRDRFVGMVVGISLMETPLRFRALRADIEQDAEATRGVVVVPLIVQLAAVRPFLQQRSSRVLAGQHPPCSRAHHAYVGLEALKVPALIALGAMALAAL